MYKRFTLSSIIRNSISSQKHSHHNCHFDHSLYTSLNMKLATPILSAVMLASSVQACIRLHVIARYNPLISNGDSMRVQIWDNNDFYEVQSQSKQGANAETRWGFAFGNGHYVELDRSGKGGFVSLPGILVTFLSRPPEMSCTQYEYGALIGWLAVKMSFCD